MTRDYRLVARLKNNRLWAAIVEKYPDVKRQSDAARRLQILRPQELGKLLNMQWWPFSTRRNDWTPLAWKLAMILEKDPAYLFDGVLYGRKAELVTLELNEPLALAAGLMPEPLALPDARVGQRELREAVQSALNDLSPKEAAVMRLRFGLDDGVEHTFLEIAERLRITSPSYVGQIEGRAFRKLRRLGHRKQLREHL